MSKVYTKGTLLQLEISSSYTTIAHRISIDGPTASVSEVDVVDLDSTIVETLPGLPDPGTVSFTCWMHDGTDAGQDKLFDLIKTPSVEDWKIIFPTTLATTLAFSGYLTTWQPTGVEANNYIQISGSIRLTTTITKTVASP